MKKYKIALFTLSLIASVAGTCAYAAENLPVEKAPVMKGTAHPLGEDLVRKITQLSSPSEKENVNILAPLSGTWDYTATIWTAQAEKPQQSMGRITNEMVLENRFLSSNEVGALNIGGHEMFRNAQGLIGYDNAQKSFTSVWVSTLGTGMMIGHGNFDKKNNILKETGSFANPISGTEEKFRSELHFTDTDHWTRTIFTTGKSGKEAKLMEFDYTRQGLSEKLTSDKNAAPH